MLLDVEKRLDILTQLLAREVGILAMPLHIQGQLQEKLGRVEQGIICLNNSS